MRKLKVPHDFIFEMEPECIIARYILNGTDGYTQKLYFKYKFKFQVSDAEHTMVTR